MSMFYYKLGPLILPPIIKVMENRNLKHVYLGTMIDYVIYKPIKK